MVNYPFRILKLIVVTVALLTGVALAQPETASPDVDIASPEEQTIEVEASARVSCAPEKICFTLHYERKGTSLEKLAEQVAGVEKQVKDGLKAVNIVPSDQEISSPVFQSGIRDGKGEVSATVTVRLVFLVTTFGQDEKRYATFGKLCDQLSVFARALGCTIESPRFIPQDARAVEDAAIGKAIENAYPSAAAAASIMKAQLVAIKKVIVEPVTWHDQVNRVSDQSPRLDTLQCEAHVRVVYSFVLDTAY